jgi:hypothetical protein
LVFLATIGSVFVLQLNKKAQARSAVVSDFIYKIYLMLKDSKS